MMNRVSTVQSTLWRNHYSVSRKGKATKTFNQSYEYVKGKHTRFPETPQLTHSKKYCKWTEKLDKLLIDLVSMLIPCKSKTDKKVKFLSFFSSIPWNMKDLYKVAYSHQIKFIGQTVFDIFNPFVLEGAGSVMIPNSNTTIVVQGLLLHLHNSPIIRYDWI